MHVVVSEPSFIYSWSIFKLTNDFFFWDTWYFNSTKLTYLQAGPNGNISTSSFLFHAEMKNDGQFLGCQATNELIEGITVEDQWRIQVHCKFKLIN